MVSAMIVIWSDGRPVLPTTVTDEPKAYYTDCNIPIRSITGSIRAPHSIKNNPPALSLLASVQPQPGASSTISYVKLQSIFSLYYLPPMVMASCHGRSVAEYRHKPIVRIFSSTSSALSKSKRGGKSSVRSAATLSFEMAWRTGCIASGWTEKLVAPNAASRQHPVGPEAISPHTVRCVPILSRRGFFLPRDKDVFISSGTPHSARGLFPGLP